MNFKALHSKIFDRVLKKFLLIPKIPVSNIGS